MQFWIENETCTRISEPEAPNPQLSFLPFFHPPLPYSHAIPIEEVEGFQITTGLFFKIIVWPEKGGC